MYWKELLTLKENISRKILLFDIDTILLRKRIGNSYSNAYTKIKDYFCSHGFLHIQSSGYETIEPMLSSEIISLYRKLLETYPYLDGCIRDVRFADITSKFYNISEIHLDDEHSNNFNDIIEKPAHSSYDDYDIDF